MQKSSKSVTNVAAAVAALLAMGAVTASGTAQAADTEKCAGIAAAGKNDCGTPTHACAGNAKTDRDAHDWVQVPKGTCAKIAGGVVTNDPANKHGGSMAK